MQTNKEGKRERRDLAQPSSSSSAPSGSGSPKHLNIHSTTRGQRRRALNSQPRKGSNNGRTPPGRNTRGQKQINKKRTSGGSHISKIEQRLARSFRRAKYCIHIISLTKSRIKNTHARTHSRTNIHTYKKSANMKLLAGY